MPWIVSMLNDCPGFRSKLAQFAWAEIERGQKRTRRTGLTIEQQISELELQAKRLAKAIAAGGKMDALVSEMTEVQATLAKARKEQSNRSEHLEPAKRFKTMKEVEERLDEAILLLAQVSREFAETLRKLVPSFVIQPVQQLDRPQVRSRAKLTLKLDAWAVDKASALTATTTIDLFDPSVHIRHLNACVHAKQANPKASLKEIASKLGISYTTVKRALDYFRKMKNAGLTEPYRELKARPASASRWTKQRRGNVSSSA